jgi:predicted lipoprotein with Yx(FWY)xxD motif
MPAQSKRPGTPLRRSWVILVVIAIGVGLAALSAAAVARTLTLNVARNAKVTSFKTQVTTLQNIAVNSRGRAVYTLSGETTHHVECIRASGCLSIWLPVTAKSAKSLSKAKGINGKLRIWHRGNIRQVTLNGRPLYTFIMDKSRNSAVGQDITHFGGTWKVVKANVKSGGSPPMPPPAPMPTPYPTY